MNIVCEYCDDIANAGLECGLKMNAKDKSKCPDESQILAFCEGSLPTRKRKTIQRHLSECDDCRESIALLAKEEDTEASEARPEELKRQVARVIQMLERDERKRLLDSGKDAAAAGRSAGSRLTGRRGLLWAAIAGLVLIIAAPAVYRVFFGQSLSSQAMELLDDAVKQSRRVEPMISAALPYSRLVSPTRGGESPDLMKYDRAIHKFDPSGAPLSLEDNIVRARILLARAEGSDAEDAYNLLQQLLRDSRGRGDNSQTSSEILNLIGVAQFEQRDFEGAIQSFTSALDRRAGYREALFNRALAEERAGREQVAEDDWRTFIEESPQDEWRTEAKAHLESH